jgi:hypothetical protein
MNNKMRLTEKRIKPEFTLKELATFKSMTAEYQIGRVKAAFAHEGMPLTDDDLKILLDCVSGRITAKEAKAAMIMKYSRTDIDNF